MEGLTNYEKEERPWGSFERFTLNERTSVKIVSVAPGEAFSLQTHDHRGEFWRVVHGAGRIVLGEETREAKTGDHFFIPAGTKHRATAGAEGLAFLEIAFGDFDENDIHRIEDRYGRA